ncbi:MULTISPECIES: hypothetical protein [Parachlamydia]|jgi:hypothetical protein|uniref:Uncharacterized protein n=1 Tax=Parachlamydia acanthamoebae (strain UV7) TaxID=765952 RepID=F8KY35_PARAV|nr:hypothetical protein [Parachlamydia acanthamoebae]EFB40892.1 hypothetical protein pah_c180o087 [Parachlamydia acanthamoebae str. Hall's coccus]CCB85781.1 putative uncharacterized protein [Parachlamydia acanthamoebae UV-7]
MRSFIHIGMIRSWWVILFVLFCLMCYEQGIKQRETDFLKLTEQLLTLQHQKKEALALKQKLLDQINSESDPAWIELTLMRELGLSPKGSTKVLFVSSESEYKKQIDENNKNR